MIILIVEDEEALAELLADALTDAGYKVVGPADTTSKALREVALTKPDLALVDVNLNEGSRGTDLVPVLYRSLGVRSIYLTSAPDDARNSALGAIGVITEPYRIQAVLDAVKFAETLNRGERPFTPPIGLHLF